MVLVAQELGRKVRDDVGVVGDTVEVFVDGKSVHPVGPLLVANTRFTEAVHLDTVRERITEEVQQVDTGEDTNGASHTVSDDVNGVVLAHAIQYLSDGTPHIVLGSRVAIGKSAVNASTPCDGEAIQTVVSVDLVKLQVVDGVTDRKRATEGYDDGLLGRVVADVTDGVGNKIVKALDDDRAGSWTRTPLSASPVGDTAQAI